MIVRSITFTLAVAGLSLGMSAAARADDELMSLCMATADQKTCQCMSTKIPPEKRASAIVAMRKSNDAIVTGTPLDPSTLSQEQMQGLDAVVLAQASCM
ncbi:hypothetical protein [Reyranella sp.]|jgi:hypothetical protein|uniref:hypothetical protein n=1 Tax=Reyranella sp. TaxID=1929291 RepID=UPI002F923C6E